MVGLVDGNNFFVSCERVFAPELEGKPVAVLSNNDGCCVSRSNEFKALGIPMGTPYFQVKPLMERYGIILRSSNYELYGDLSRRIIATLEEFAPRVEQYSIDEAFIHPQLAEDADYFAFGCRIRNTVLQWVGIPCGVGFAPSRTLAKIANHIGKKLPTGVFVMPKDPQPVLEKLPVSEVWGVGRALAPKLERLGIRTAWQLAKQDPATMRKKFSVTVARTVMELRGISCIEEEPPEELSKSISCSRSFGYPVTALSDLEESVATYAARAAEKLRKEHQVAAGANIYLQGYPEKAQMHSLYAAATIVFPSPTDDTGMIISAIRPKLAGLFTPGTRYRKSGVIFFGLEDGQRQQQELFQTAPPPVNSALFKVADKLNAKFGRGTIFTLGEGISKPWQMKRDLLTPSYTTNWDQIPRVK